MLKRPPDVLITTPESLYLMLTSQARETLRSVRWVIIDEIHAMAATKRGAHLADLARAPGAADRHASATDRLVGDAASARGDRALPRRADDRRATARHDRRRRPSQADGDRGDRPGRGHGRARRASSSDGSAPNDARAVDRRPLAVGGLHLARDPSEAPGADPRASLDDRLRERAPHGRTPGRASQRARRGGPGARAPRLARARAADRGRGRAEGGTPARDRRHVLARARHRHGRRRPGDPGGVARARSRAACSASAAPAIRSASPAAGRSSRSSAATCWRPRS